MAFQIVGLDHVQLAMPPGGEDAARAFYGDLLGLEELEKPPVLARRGGCWFRAGNSALHLGVEADFRPARKAHPALVVDDLTACAELLSAAGASFVPDDALEGVRRGYVDDCFGNRLELLEAPHR